MGVEVQRLDEGLDSMTCRLDPVPSRVEESPALSVAPSPADDAATCVEGPGPGPLRVDDAPRGPRPVAALPARIGRFAILKVLGTGGMGVVYSAFDDELNRKVAIKLLHQAKSRDAEHRQRMLREAQALARVAHPNVVRIYEVGEVEDQLFLTMEFLEGETLRRWQRARRRTWRETLAVFVRAGRGLEAAHATGLVHRDFKPDNVLVGADESVHVVDFGLARADEAGFHFQELSSDVDGLTRSDSLGDPLTQVGTLIGTPAYMSLEQLERLPATPQSDQFSFCVALYEGLYGERPFAAQAIEDVKAAVRAGEVREAPRGAAVPSRLRRVILRGLAADPGDRWPSMRELLAALEDDPGRRVRRWAASVGLIALATASGFAVASRGAATSTVCEDAASRLAGVWDAPRRESVERAFLATKLAYAPSVLSRVVKLLDDYTARWSEAHVRVCEAAALRGRSSPILDPRMACLNHRRAELRELVDLLREVDTAMVDRAVQAAAELRPLDACLGAAEAAGEARLPADPATAAVVEELRDELAAIWANQLFGRYTAGLERLALIARRADAIAFEPLIAEVHVTRGELQHDSGAFADAEASLLDAFFAAESLDYDRVRLDAALRLTYLVGAQAMRHDEGLLWGRHVEAMLGRAADDPSAEIEYLHAIGSIYDLKGDVPAAKKALEKSLRLTERLFGGAAPKAAPILLDLGNLYADRGDFAAAQPYYERALEVLSASLSPEHPFVVKALNNLGNTLRGRGDLGGARALHERGVELAERVLPSDHPSKAIVLDSLAVDLLEEGRPDAAAPLLVRALAAGERSLGADHPIIAAFLSDLAVARLRVGAIAEARRDLERALAILEAIDPEGVDLAAPLMAMGEVEALEGSTEAAGRRFQRAIDLVRRAHGGDHRDAVPALIGLGELARADERFDDAIEVLERAQRAAAAPEVLPAWGARIDFALARALWDGNIDRSRALALARQARAGFQAAGSGFTRELIEVRRWLAGH